MRRVVFDTETNGLLPEMTTMHSLVLRDLETDVVLSCTDHDPERPSIAYGLDVLSRADVLYGHNALAFDIPAIQKLYPEWTYTGKVRDTYVTAAMAWAHIQDTDFDLFRKGVLPAKLIGRQSLEAWGHRLGIPKGECADFSVWTPEMQTYCEQDTLVTAALVQRIGAAKLPPEAIETEHALARYLIQQEANGWPFDVEKAHVLQGRLAQVRHDLEGKLAILFPPWQKSLGLFVPKVNNKARGYVKGEPIERFKDITFNPGSRDMIADRLATLYGWTPTEFTDSGKPKIDEETLAGLDFPGVPELRQYLLVGKRLGQLAEGKEAWLGLTKHNAITGLEHIHGHVLQNRAVTHRAAHAHPNIAQVPSVVKPYGPECRELFHVPEGWLQLGADASGLELRCLGHYMAKYDGGQFGKSLLTEKPNDAHTLNAKILGVSRDTGKTFIYALLYGAGDEKLGKIILPAGASSTEQEKAGAGARKKLLHGLPALRHLSDNVKRQAKSRGYLRLIDGRKTYIRSEHAALNSLLQGTGAVLCKRWGVDFSARLTERFGPQGWTGQWAALAWVHDEFQLAVRPDIAEEVGTILIASMRSLTDRYAFRVPLDAAARTGKNWRETH